MAIIELIILGLSIYEYILLKRNLIGTHSYFKVEPKHMGGKAVMSGLIDEEKRLNNSNYS
jgi:hypothetical protein